jgi:hypothetical protein
MPLIDEGLTIQWQKSKKSKSQTMIYKSRHVTLINIYITNNE